MITPIKRKTLTLVSAMVLGLSLSAAPLVSAEPYTGLATQGQGGQGEDYQAWRESICDRNRSHGSTGDKTPQEAAIERRSNEIDVALKETVRVRVSEYTHDLETCNLGLRMPGMPTLGADVRGGDSCRILRNITGSTVAEANRAMQRAVDGLLGMGNVLNFDMSDILSDVIQSSGGYVDTIDQTPGQINEAVQ